MHNDAERAAVLGNEAIAPRAWVLPALLVLTVVVLFPYRNFAGDDAYISFQFARNLANGGGFSFNHGTPTYGSTAPLWVFLMAGLHRLGMSMNDAAHALNWVFSLGAVALSWVFAGLYFKSLLPRAALVLLVAVDPWFVRWAMSGMENALALCLLLAVLITQQHYKNSGRINWVTPLCLGLITLTRPEGLVLTGLAALDVLLQERRRKWGTLIVGGLIYAATVGPWLLYAWSEFGSIVPNTIAAKLSRNHATSLVSTIKYFVSFWLVQAVALALVPFVIGLDRVRQGLLEAFRGPWLLPCAWALVLPLFYVTGGAPVSARYLMFGLPCYLLVGIKAWSLLLPKFPRLVPASFAASIAMLGYVHYKYCWYLTAWTEGMDPRMIEVARYLKANSRPDEVVAADQIGVIGYFSERPLLDIFGLASPEVLRFRKDPDENAIWRYLWEKKVDYLFVIDDMPVLLARDPAYASLTLLRQTLVQREGASGAGSPQMFYLYRTNWKNVAP